MGGLRLRSGSGDLKENLCPCENPALVVQPVTSDLANCAEKLKEAFSFLQFLTSNIHNALS
jgi:hypothetical protein